MENEPSSQGKFLAGYQPENSRDDQSEKTKETGLAVLAILGFTSLDKIGRPTSEADVDRYAQAMVTLEYVATALLARSSTDFRHYQEGVMILVKHLAEWLNEAWKAYDATLKQPV